AGVAAGRRRRRVRAHLDEQQLVVRAPAAEAGRPRERGADLGEAQDVAVEVPGALQVTHVEHRVAELDRLHPGTTFPALPASSSLTSTPPHGTTLVASSTIARARVRLDWSRGRAPHAVA